MAQCVFCSFEDKGVVIYDDDRCFAIISLNPINQHHVLVIPKEHYENFVDLPDELVSHLFLITKKVSIAIRKACSPVAVHHITDDDIGGKGFNLVPHFKIHIIPRFEDDEVQLTWGRSRQDLGIDERERIARQVKDALG